MDIGRAQALTRTLVTAYLQRELLGDPAFESFLSRPWVESNPELILEEEL